MSAATETGIAREHLAIESIDRAQLEDVFNALLCYGVSGRYDTLTQAVQALGRRAEAAELAAPEEASLQQVLLPIVRALSENMTGDIETIVLTALAVQRELGRTCRIYVEESP